MFNNKIISGLFGRDTYSYDSTASVSFSDSGGLPRWQPLSLYIPVSAPGVTDTLQLSVMSMASTFSNKRQVVKYMTRLITMHGQTRQHHTL